jgi:putative endonuclease
MDPRHALGARAEESAARALVGAGLRIVARNVRLGGGEIDLVCRDGDAWVFVEVKARRPGWDDGPGAAVSWAKRRRLVRLAQQYLKWHHLGDVRYRFDVVEVTDNGRAAAVIRHLRGAFDAGPG